uniref:Putative WRKY transcription factor 70 n=1 Tax=Noccaea caerulescens TaxID=107243 RepID=A0A1J3G890_NOCCA
MDIISNNKAIKLKDQLVQGHEWTTKLQQIISQPGSGLGAAEDLAAKILGSFNDIISSLESLEPISSSSLVTAVEGSQNASCDNDGKFEDSGDSRKRLGPVKGKRGCYKRKKKSDQTWTVESTVLEDEFSWRKYGQKEILNTKFPRSYFRCTHKYSKGCKATKQVQKLELEPKMFNITYIGNHTCNTNEITPKIIKPCVRSHHDEIIMDSEELESPSLATSMKVEEEIHHGSSTESDMQLVWQDILVCEENNHHPYEDIYGCYETSAPIDVLDSADLWSWQRFPVQQQ